jgi:hypothetical protein
MATTEQVDLSFLAQYFAIDKENLIKEYWLNKSLEYYYIALQTDHNTPNQYNF